MYPLKHCRYYRHQRHYRHCRHFRFCRHHRDIIRDSKDTTDTIDTKILQTEYTKAL